MNSDTQAICCFSFCDESRRESELSWAAAQIAEASAIGSSKGTRHNARDLLLWCTHDGAISRLCAADWPVQIRHCAQRSVVSVFIDCRPPPASVIPLPCAACSRAAPGRAPKPHHRKFTERGSGREAARPLAPPIAPTHNTQLNCPPRTAR